MKQLSLLGLLTLAGCANDPGSGAIELALTTTDGAGTVYRLPPYASIGLHNDTFHDSFPLDGNSTTVRIDVPPGQYEASVGDEGSQWQLERHIGGGPAETVLGTLVTPMPITIEVAEGGTARIELSFRVPDRGMITFEDSGSVAVSFDVTRGTPAGYEIQAGASLFQVGISEDPASITAHFPETGDTNIPFQFAARLSGDFARTSSRAICAPLEVSRLESESADGLQDLLAEATASGSTAQVCLDHDYLTIDLRRTGSATTSTFAETGDADYFFDVMLYTHLEQSVYESETLDLDALLDAHTVTLQMMGSAYGGATTGFEWSFRVDYQGEESGLLFGATY